MSARNGQVRAQKEVTREQSKEQRHNKAHSTHFQQDGSLRREYIESLTDTVLSAETIERLDNLVTRDWVLSHLQEAEIEEIKFRIHEIVKLEITNQHPRRGSNVTGIRRAWMLDDETEALRPLSEQERQVVENFLHGVFFGRVTRARGGWQQEQMSKTISVSETRDQREEKDGLLGGLLGR